MKDPTLAPLFQGLIAEEHPALKVHGLLGMAQIDPDGMVDLTRIVSLDNRVTQSQALSAALDSKLLSSDQAQQLLDSPGIDEGVKVVLAIRLIGEPEFKHVDLLEQASQSEILARNSLAALALLQLGHEDALGKLQALNQSTDPQRDNIRLMLLRTALKCEYDRAGPWAAEISVEPAIVPRLNLLAIHVALRFGATGAEQIWQREFDATIDSAQRARLALLALHLSSYVKSEIFEVLLRTEDPLLKQVGLAGKAVRSGDRPVEAVVQLIQMQNPPVNQWALAYARNADPDQSVRILLALILSVEQELKGNAGTLLNNVAQATQTLFDLEPERATQLLRPKLTDPAADPHLIQAILSGLIQAKEADPWRVVDGLLPLAHPNANNLAVLLLARHGQSLDQQQLEDLRVVVRGGGGLPNGMRVQAAWIYLKITNQTDKAVAEIFGRS